MKFNSQICTTKEQSKKLLACGLRKETADMTYFNDEICLAAYNEMECPYDNLVHPAWSLHRLMEMCNHQVIHNRKKYEPAIAIDGMAYQDVCSDDPIVGWSGDLYTDVIDCIEWLIKEGYFNKEYLE